MFWYLPVVAESDASGAKVLVEFISSVLNESSSRSGYIKLISPSSTDIGLAANWLSLNRYIGAMSDVQRTRKGYVVVAARHVDFEMVVFSIQARFGRFGRFVTVEEA